MKTNLIFSALFVCTLLVGAPAAPNVDNNVHIMPIMAKDADFDGNGKTTKAEVLAFVRLNGSRK
jgi:hypothetical protein